MVANREKIDCGGRCLALSILMQEHVVTIDFYVLPVATCHVVLGVQCLATLGPIKKNYRNLIMNFTDSGMKCTFHTLSHPALETLSNKYLLNL